MFGIDYNSLNPEDFKDELARIDKHYNKLMNSKSFVKKFAEIEKKNQEKVEYNKFNEYSGKYKKIKNLGNRFLTDLSYDNNDKRLSSFSAGGIK